MNDDLIDDGIVRDASPNFDGKTITQINDAKIEVNDHLRKMKIGRWVLFSLAAISIFQIVTFYLYESTLMDFAIVIIAITLITSIIPYGTLGLLFPKNPVLFLSIGLGIYVLGMLAEIILIGPVNLRLGYIYTIGVPTALGFSLYSALQWRRNIAKLAALGLPAHDLEIAKKQLLPLKKTKRPKHSA